MTYNEVHNFYINKKILITGNSGFKGTWLSILLKELGAEVYGLSLAVSPGNQNLFLAGSDVVAKQYLSDIRNYDKLQIIVNEVQPDIIFHLAANAITLAAYENPLQNFETNALGTANILETLRFCDKKCIAIIVTSDRCYKNNEWVWGYRENDTLAGIDPYSASKSVAEIITQSYYHSFFKRADRIKLSSCRSGNAIGGGDWNIHRIVPDCIKAWHHRQPIIIRNPNYIRPWNYVLDSLSGYIVTAFHLEHSNINGEAFNFGPNVEDEITVRELVDKLWEYWEPKEFVPYSIQDTESAELEYKSLKLNSDKAYRILQWRSQTNINTAIAETAKWYLVFGKEPQSITEYSQILVKKYLNLVFSKN